MQEHCSDRAADQGELLIGVAAPVIHVKFHWDPVGRHRLFEHFLEAVSIIIVKEPAAYQEAGMVVNDHDAVNAPAFSVFCDVRQVACVRLPHFPECIFLKSLPVFHVGIPGGFQVMVPDKTLDRADIDCGGDKRILHKLFVNLGGVEPRECLLKAVDLLDGSVRQHPGGSFVRTLLWHQRVNPACLVEGYPFADGLWVVLESGAVRKCQGFFRDPPVISIPGRVRIKPVDHRGNDREPELRDFCCVSELLFLIFHETGTSFSFSTIVDGNQKSLHPHGVWSVDDRCRDMEAQTGRRRGSGHGRGIPVGLEEGISGFIRKTAGEKGILRQPGNPKEEIQPGGFRVFQHPEPFLFVLGKDLFPFIELVPGNAEAFTEVLNGRTAQESFRQDTEDKKEAITGIGDDHIREDGMGMPAAYADQPEDRDFLCDGFPMDKIDDAAAIVSMDMAVAGGTADGAGLPFGAERSHIGLEQNF